MKILKFPLDLCDHQTIEMPINAQILTVQIQHDKLCIWALCDETKDTIPIVISLYGTGNPIKEQPGQYIGTVQMYNGTIVFHAFKQ